MLRAIKRKKRDSRRAGISVDGSVHAVARVTEVPGDKPALEACVLDLPSGPVGTAAVDLGDLKVRNIPVSVVLDEADYTLQLVEKPPVPPEELRQAIRWRIKDFIDYPLDEAAVDVFDLPKQSNASARDIAYAVVAKEETVEQAVTGSRVYGALDVDTIDVPELCLRNLSARLPGDEHGTALLHFLEDDAYLTITRGGTLHVVRQISSGRRVFVENADDDFFIRERASGIALEVQRSLDYYESHYDYRPISKLVLGPGEGLQKLPAYLNEDLGIEVETLDLADHFELASPLDDKQQGHCLLAVGAALRCAVPAEDDQRINLLAPEVPKKLAEFPVRFIVQALAASVVLMAALSFWAEQRLVGMENEAAIVAAQEADAAAKLAGLRSTMDEATGGQSWGEQLDRALDELEQRQALLGLIQSTALGESDGFAAHLRALARQNVDGMWLTYISLSAGGEQTRLEGRTIKAELIPMYLQNLIDEGPFARQRFHQFEIDNPVDAEGPALVFSMDSAQLGIDVQGGRK